MGPGYTMLRPSLFFKFFFGKIIAIINGTTTTKSLRGGKRVRLQVKAFLKSGLVPLSAIDGIAQAKNSHRQFTAGVDVDFHPAVPCVIV